MPELKNAEDFILEDEEVRELLTAFALRKWGDPQAQPLIRAIENRLNLNIRHGDVRLGMKYSPDAYNKATGRKTMETLSEGWAAHDALMEKAAAIFQTALSQAVKTALCKAIEDAADAAGDAVIKELGEKVKSAETQSKRKFGRGMSEALGIAPPLGRPQKYTKEYVERRSIEIIRAIDAGSRDKGRVAVVFYNYGAHPKSAGRGKLLKMYHDLKTDERQKELNKFNALLDDKDLTYKYLLAKSTEKSKRRKRKK